MSKRHYIEGGPYYVERGAYQGTSDDRLDRWYIGSDDSDTVDRRGPGYETRDEAEARVYEIIAHTG